MDTHSNNSEADSLQKHNRIIYSWQKKHKATSNLYSYVIYVENYAYINYIKPEII